MVDVASKALQTALATTPEAHGIDDWRFNDGKGTPGGELIIGRMHSKWREGTNGRLYRCVTTLVVVKSLGVYIQHCKRDTPCTWKQ